MTSEVGFSLQTLASIVEGRIQGDPTMIINGLNTLNLAGKGELSFFANPRYLHQLSESEAAAVLVSSDYAHLVKNTALIVADPYLAFAKLTHHYDWRRPAQPGVSSKAIVDPTAVIHESAQVCANVVIEAGVSIAANVYIGPGCVIGSHSTLGEACRLEANVTLYPNVHLGQRVLIHSGSVLGADGFGFAREQRQWIKICQLGGVRVGDDVEIGASVTIDRGALADTVIEKGVKLDNQIQIAHNVRIGEHTAIAGGTAVAGSTRIGKYCTIAGMSGITGHLEIADNTHITAMTLVSKSINKAGAYSSGTGQEPHQQWKRNVVRFRQLDELAKRVRKLEQTLAEDNE